MQPVVRSLAYYPVKGCAGIEVDELALDDEGPRFDREWMVVDEQGVFVTQRDTPALARVGVALDEEAGRLRLDFAGADAIDGVSLTVVGVESLLVLSPPDAANRLVASHRITHVSIGDGAERQRYDMATVASTTPLALPVDVSLADGRIYVSDHRLSTRYGTLARDTLGAVVMPQASLPPTSMALAGDIADLVQGAQRGCAAIEPIVCAAARLDAGCLGAACQNGISALARYLDSGFDALSTGADLTLGGSAPLLDDDNNASVDRLGDDAPGGTPGGWNHATLQMAGESVTPLTAEFTGKRD